MKKYLVIFSLCLATTLHGNASYANSFLKNVPETVGLVSAGNKPVTLLGSQVNVGDSAPNFKVVNEKFAPISLSDLPKHPILISVVPSLDTGVCSLQTKRFNDEIDNINGDFKVLTISNDLPFAQKRFCKTEKIEKLQVVSDAVWHDFGLNYGLMIKDMGLLTRAIFIIDNVGKVHYKELVENISQHPNYDNALASLKSLLKETPTETTQQTN